MSGSQDKSWQDSVNDAAQERIGRRGASMRGESAANRQWTNARQPGNEDKARRIANNPGEAFLPED